MNILSSLILCGFQQEALAGTPYQSPIPVMENLREWRLSDKMGSVESVDIGENVIDIPLYSDEAGLPRLLSYVSVEPDGKEELSIIAPDSSSIIVSAAFAKENEWEIKVTNKRIIPVPDDFRVGGKIQYVEIPELYVGSLKLVNVVAFVNSKEFTGFQDLGSGDFYCNTCEMQVGLKGLPISYAILQSEGILRVSSLEKGAQLRSELQGTEVSYREVGHRIGRLNKVDFGQDDTILAEQGLIVQASFQDGKPVPTILSTRYQSSQVGRYYPAESQISSYTYDMRSDYLSPSVGGETLTATYVTRPTNADLDDPDYPVAVIGNDVLLHYDMVVDQEAKIVSLKKNQGYKRTNPSSIEFEKAKKTLDEAYAEQTKEEGAEETEAETPIAAISTFVGSLEKLSKRKEILPYLKQLLEDEEEKTDCSLWSKYGDAHLWNGKLTEAKSAYQESARLYHSWWDIDLNTRMDIQKAQGKMEEEEITAAKERSKTAEINAVDDGWYISQPGSCYTADGMVAHIDVLLGNYNDVTKSYREKLDLDGGLARAQAAAALLQGDTERAHEAYRQAILLENGLQERSFNRLGLAVVYADQGKWSQADELFQEAMSLQESSLITYMWADQSRAVLGGKQTLANLKSLVASRPQYTSARLGLLREYYIQLSALSGEISSLETEVSSSGNSDPERQSKLDTLKQEKTTLETEQRQAQIDVLAYFDEIDFIHANDRTLKQSATIEMYTLTGQLEKAEALVSEVRYFSSGVFFAIANLYSAQGKAEEAQQELLKTAATNPNAIGNVLLLAQSKAQ